VAGYETLQWQQDGHVATLTLDRPEKKNAMSWVMFGELKQAFERAADDHEVRCLIVTGAGGAFWSGADLSDAANLPSSSFEMKDRMRFIDAVASSFITCPKPTIAKVTGVAAGAGCNLALGCDLIVASRSASFAELFVKRGLVVDFGGSWVLTRALPLHKAKELALLGNTISAAEADRFGLLNRLCDDGDIDGVVEDLAGQLVALPPRAVSMTKANLNRAQDRTLEETLEAEAAAQALSFSSQDTTEAVTAWLEKRTPRFTGR
jgi:2-(1,2-epoxy-1,2-dihydrophenyl)acetyl-CoA isomerase